MAPASISRCWRRWVSTSGSARRGSAPFIVASRHLGAEVTFMLARPGWQDSPSIPTFPKDWRLTRCHTKPRMMSSAPPMSSAANAYGNGHPPPKKMEVNETIPKGIPGRALNYMIGQMRSIPTTEIARAIGIRHRTMQRYASQKSASLGGAPSARLWKLAEILVAAVDLQGSRAAGEKWSRRRRWRLIGARPLR